MKKKLLTGLVTALFLVEMIGVASAAPTQWLSSEGGNDHWYEIVLLNNYTSWTDARTNAELATHSDMQGYLASITSDTENTFVANLFTAMDWKYNGINGFMGPWIGGYQPNNSDWTWTSGETWDYTAWESNQPSNQSDQDYLHYYIKLGSTGNPLEEPPTWNDLQNNSEKVFGYVVEYNPVPIPATIFLFGSGLAWVAGIRIRRKKK